jgi:hypothetical protein
MSTSAAFRMLEVRLRMGIENKIISVYAFFVLHSGRKCMSVDCECTATILRREANVCRLPRAATILRKEVHVCRLQGAGTILSQEANVCRLRDRKSPH